MILAPSAASQNQRRHSGGHESASGRRLRQSPRSRLCAACIRAHMEFLASDALRGRGSGTADELVAATYVGRATACLRDRSGRRQRRIHSAGRAPTAKIDRAAPDYICEGASGGTAETITWTCGQEFIARRLSQTHFSGKLRIDHPAQERAQGKEQNQDKRQDEDGTQLSGCIVLIVDGTGDRKKQRARLRALAAAGAVAAIEWSAPKTPGISRKKERICPSCQYRSKEPPRAERQFQCFAGRR